MAKNILADTGFWFALYEPYDQFHSNAITIESLISEQNLLVPWPSLYETINTKFSKRKDYMQQFDMFLARSNVHLVDDNEVKGKALELTFEYSRLNKQTYSLVDVVIREILADDSYKIDYLVTFNSKDFYDVCYRRKIDIYN